jgi:uncharacterized protein YyaL (SSP411 family)
VDDAMRCETDWVIEDLYGLPRLMCWVGCQCEGMSNRLSKATSPYLLQHATNPIEWWEWGADAFAEAERRNVPILLSVGYAACHWCHVMAHESFTDVDTARQVNAEFIAIKVDREERPDIDAIYLAATRAMTGSAGWPLTCILTPTGEPFHCGTYYPKEPRPGQPGFRQMLSAATKAWQTNGALVQQTATRIAMSLDQENSSLTPPRALDHQALETAVETLASSFDTKFGGFGGAPKFPPSMALEFLLRNHERTGSQLPLNMAEETMDRMARGGMYDQLGGGFSRYSVDAQWVVPHFEKMLYDNALLLRAYAHLGRRTGSPLANRVAVETAAFMMADLVTADGGFASALDADTDGVEGRTYAWTPAELILALGAEDGVWASRLLGVDDAGTFEDDASVLQLREDPDDIDRWNDVRARLRTNRALRPQPSVDDKVVTAWNGLAIAALAEAGAAEGRKDWVLAAMRAADLIIQVHLVDGRLRRSSRNGVVGSANGVLEDYACFADGLLALHQATGDPKWLTAATDLLQTALDRFSANFDEPGHYFDTADDTDHLLQRRRDLTDGATPSGASALAGALMTASVLAPLELSDRLATAAQSALETAGSHSLDQPRFAGNWLAVAEAIARGPLQITVVGHDDDREFRAMTEMARRSAPGGSIILAGRPDAASVPILHNRPLVDGRAAAYVCRGYVCDRPVTSADKLLAAFG